MAASMTNHGNNDHHSALKKEYPLIIPYQISLEHASTGKHIGFTKRRFRCKFGFAHIGSVLKGMTGVDCRGMEMEVQLVWSVTGGKYTVLFNHQVIHRADRNTTAVGLNSQHDNQKSLTRIEHRFRIPEIIFPGGHDIYISAHSFSRENQFELRLDGQSYLHFLPVFELGMPIMHNFYGQSLQAIRSKYLQQSNSLEHATTLTNTPNKDHSNNYDDSVVDLLVQGRPRFVPGVSTNKKYSNQSNSTSHVNHTTQNHNHTSHHKNDDLPIATSLEEEQQMIARARLASLQDLRAKNSNSNNNNNNNNNTNNVNTAFRTSQTSQSRPLQAVAEMDDFIDLTSNAAPSAFPIPPNRPDLLRSTSSLTNDFDEDNTVSYDHLDPNKMFQTQQNMHLSFKFQTAPPTYADSTMGDLAMSTRSAAPTNLNHNPNQFTAATPSPSIHSYPPSMHSSMPAQTPNPYGAAPPPPSWEDIHMTTNNYTAAPPPTWEDLSTNFSQSINYGTPSQQPQQQQQQQQQKQQQPNVNYPNFASPPPLYSNNW